MTNETLRPTGVGHDSQTARGPRRLSLSDLREARAWHVNSGTRPNRTGDSAEPRWRIPIDSVLRLLKLDEVSPGPFSA